MSHIYCPECGFQSPEAATYCSRCGALLGRESVDETTMSLGPDELEANLAENIDELGCGARSHVVRLAALRALAAPEVARERFDLVFLDPPYAVEGPDLQPTLGRLADDGALSSGWTVVLTRGHKGSLPAVPLDWAVARRLRYGDSLLTLYREVGWS